jgi:diguanylate cyclase (GGDEF)-like protein/PAS domain S-box-containing protein
MDQYDLAASGARDGLWDWDLVSNRVHFSPRWISMVGCEESEVGSSPEEWLERIHSEDQPRVRREIETNLASGARDFDIDHRMRQRNGTYRWMTCRGVVVRDASGTAVRLMGSHADVTADHVADPLTGLPNRVLFLDRLTRSIGRAGRNPDFLYAVLLIDLDRPNPEEAAGHVAGDPLLTASARRLETCLRGAEGSPFPGDDYVVARLRGSQFALLLEGLSRVGEVHASAERVLAALLAPLQLRGRQVFPRASIGIAVSATGYTRTEDVMRDADAALYRARSLGGNRCEVFDIDLLQSADARLELEADLAQALDRHEFLLFYQPVLAAASNRIVGLEALVRWQHPARGMIPPVEFIPIAEKTGFIVPLGNWILREACLQLKAWQESLPIAKDLWVSVNLSSVQFKQPGIVDRVGEALRDVGLDPSCLMRADRERDGDQPPSGPLMQLRVMGADRPDVSARGIHPRLPAPVPGRRPQGRPVLHPRHGSPSGQGGHRGHRRRARRPARAARNRRRDRERCRAGPDPVAAVRVRAGIPLLQAG